MKYIYFILVTTELYFSIVECALLPDINLEGRLLTNNDSKVLQLTCSTNIAVQLCSVEFLIDKKTHDNIRFFNNNCYHTMRICSPSVCTCSDDCMSFTLNVTVTQDMMNYSYSCASRIENEGVIYLANISVIHDGNGGSYIKKVVVPSNSVSPPQKATTLSPDISTVSSFSVPLIIVCTAFGFLSCVLLVILLSMICRKRYCDTKSEQKQNISTIEDLGKKAGFVTNRQTLPSTNDSCSRRQWKKTSPTLEYSKQPDKVSYLDNKEKMSTISTVSGSTPSLENITFLSSYTSSRNDSYA